jgi:Glycine/D-amino acid oxidases (deaminating)
MEVLNDNSCSWVNDLSPRNNIVTLSSDIDCEWLIVGAGYTGLSAARKLGQLLPKSKKYYLVDASTSRAKGC